MVVSHIRLTVNYSYLTTAGTPLVISDILKSNCSLFKKIFSPPASGNCTVITVFTASISSDTRDFLNMGTMTLTSPESVEPYRAVT